MIEIHSVFITFFSVSFAFISPLSFQGPNVARSGNRFTYDAEATCAVEPISYSIWKQEAPESPEAPSPVSTNFWKSMVTNVLNEFEGHPIKPDAWRVAVTSDGSDAPPSLEAFLTYGARLPAKHEAEVQKLCEVVKRYPLAANELNKVIEAIRIAYVALYGKTTMRSQEVAINRAKGIAEVLLEFGSVVNIDVVLAGILHDVFSGVTEVIGPTIRDTLVHKFGEKVIENIENYAKLPKFMARTAEYTEEQAEWQQQMIVALSEDYSVINIRLADRLHTMRVIDTLPLETNEKMKIAEEALYVYASLAGKMSRPLLKEELEHIAFQILNPDMFQKIKNDQLSSTAAYFEAKNAIEEFLNNDIYLKKNNVTAALLFRIKGRYQQYLKMIRKNLTDVRDVRDALGLRIIINATRNHEMKETIEAHEEREIDLCYYIVGKLRSMPFWKEPDDHGCKDYIANPKENGYRSIHQYLQHKTLGATVEIQVRTGSMHRVAELGEAAHWFYKDCTYKPDVVENRLYKLAWRSEQQAFANSALMLIKLAKYQLNSKRVFVFLHDRSTVLNMRRNSTALDAAFAVHSELGLMTKAVRINGKRVGLNHILKNGDVISVEREENGKIMAKPSWLVLVATPHAKNVLAKHIKSNHRESLVATGCALLIATLGMNKDMVLANHKGSKPLSCRKFLSLVLARTASRSMDDLLLLLGGASSKMNARAVMSLLLNVSLEDLVVPSNMAAFAWLQAQHFKNWNGFHLERDVMTMLLRTTLPALGLPYVEQKWCDLLRIEYQKPRGVAAPLSPTHMRIPFNRPGSSPLRHYPSGGKAPLYVPSIYLKSPIAKANNPFSLEASSMPVSLGRLAKLEFAAKAKAMERRSVEQVVLLQERTVPMSLSSYMAISRPLKPTLVSATTAKLPLNPNLSKNTQLKEMALGLGSVEVTNAKVDDSVTIIVGSEIATGQELGLVRRLSMPGASLVLRSKESVRDLSNVQNLSV